MWNEFLDKIKFTSVLKCRANNWDQVTGRYRKPCLKYTHGKYCRQHSIELARACEQYHYTRFLSKNDPMLHYWAKKELNERIEFCERFSISNDYGHTKWNEYLQNIINQHEQRVIFAEKNKRERLQQRFDRVLEDMVCPRELNDCRISLETMKNYKRDVAADGDWIENVNFEENLSENQFKKININKHLFNTYYKRSSLNDVKHLNLIEVKLEKKCFSVYSDEDDW